MKYQIENSYKAYKDFLLNIEKYFSNSNNSIHKARNELKIIKYKDKIFIVKSFKVPNLFKSIIYKFKDSKAKKSYINSIRINQFAPKAVGYIEFYQNGLLKNSYFISEYFDYDFTIREPLLNKNFFDREVIFKDFARFTLKLHNKNIFHKDYSPGNILIKKDKNNYIFKIVDLNRMGFFDLKCKDRAKGFSKLWANKDILELIALEYQTSYECKNFTKKVLKFDKINKNIKNSKKKLKGLIFGNR